MKSCMSCGREIEEASNFCMTCGADQSGRPQMEGQVGAGSESVIPTREIHPGDLDLEEDEQNYHPGPNWGKVFGGLWRVLRTALILAILGGAGWGGWWYWENYQSPDRFHSSSRFYVMDENYLSVGLRLDYHDHPTRTIIRWKSKKFLVLVLVKKNGERTAMPVLSGMRVIDYGEYQKYVGFLLFSADDEKYLRVPKVNPLGPTVRVGKHQTPVFGLWKPEQVAAAKWAKAAREILAAERKAKAAKEAKKKARKKRKKSKKAKPAGKQKGKSAPARPTRTISWKTRMA